MASTRPKWAVAKYAAGINWVDMQEEKPAKGQEVLLYIPYSFKQMRYVKEYDPDDRVYQMAHAWAPVNYPFKLSIRNERKVDDQIDLPFN